MHETHGARTHAGHLATLLRTRIHQGWLQATTAGRSFRACGQHSTRSGSEPPHMEPHLRSFIAHVLAVAPTRRVAAERAAPPVATRDAAPCGVSSAAVRVLRVVHA